MPEEYDLNPAIPFMHEKERDLKELEELYDFKDIQNLVYYASVVKFVDKNDAAKFRYDFDIWFNIENFDMIQMLNKGRKEESLEGIVTVFNHVEGRSYDIRNDYGDFQKYIKK